MANYHLLTNNQRYFFEIPTTLLYNIGKRMQNHNTNTSTPIYSVAAQHIPLKQPLLSCSVCAKVKVKFYLFSFSLRPLVLLFGFLTARRRRFSYIFYIWENLINRNVFHFVNFLLWHNLDRWSFRTNSGDSLVNIFLCLCVCVVDARNYSRCSFVSTTLNQKRIKSDETIHLIQLCLRRSNHSAKL